jgi:hypothetical protein
MSPAGDGAVAWECPCGWEPPRRGSNAIPVRTFVSLREPKCHYCGGSYKDEYRVSDARVSDTDRAEAIRRARGEVSSAA